MIHPRRLLATKARASATRRRPIAGDAQVNYRALPEHGPDAHSLKELLAVVSRGSGTEGEHSTAPWSGIDTEGR